MSHYTEGTLTDTEAGAREAQSFYRTNIVTVSWAYLKLPHASAENTDTINGGSFHSIKFSSTPSVNGSEV